MGWTVGKKIVLVGISITLALGLLAGNMYRNSSTIGKKWAEADLRIKQIDMCQKMLISNVEVVLAAMDAIVDKDDGKISEDRIKIIESRIAFIKEHLDQLVELADTEEEKKEVKIVQDTLPILARSIQTDLRKLIEGSAVKIKQTEEAFKKIDDSLDELGDGVRENLALIFTSVQKRRMEATDVDVPGNNQMLLLNNLMAAHSNLMLTAMDTIVDKDEGRINEQRMSNINENIGFIMGRMDELVKLATTEEEKTAAKSIQKAFPLIAKGIQSDLKLLIEEGTAQVHKIQADFVQIDDTIDQLSAPIVEALTAMVDSVHKEQEEATAALSKEVSLATRINLVISIVFLAVVIPFFSFFSRSITKPLKRVIEGLRTGAQQVASASLQISSASQQLATGTSEQAAAMEETSSSLEEMASMTKQNADNAGEANQLMLQATKVVAEVSQSMGQLTTSMAKISGAGEEIQKIIKTIDEIAFQTNLLALNAAVEAARAGEAGAGFAVVADEVRNLALRAAEAAKNTAVLIEDTVKRVRDGAELVQETDLKFNGVAACVAKSGELVGEIAAASREQALGIDQVNKAVAQMDNVIQQNAASSEESAAASKEMNAQAAQMEEFVVELVSLVDNKEGEAMGRQNPRATIKNGNINQNTKPGSVSKVVVRRTGYSGGRSTRASKIQRAIAPELAAAGSLGIKDISMTSKLQVTDK